MTQLKMLSPDDKLAEIRRLYFSTSKQTIANDLAKALDLLKSMASDEERERASVYMEGLAEMRRDWSRETPVKRSPSSSQRTAKQATSRARGAKQGSPSRGAAPQGSSPARSGQPRRPRQPEAKPRKVR
jgi:hypothetical protein